MMVTNEALALLNGGIKCCWFKHSLFSSSHDGGIDLATEVARIPRKSTNAANDKKRHPDKNPSGTQGWTLWKPQGSIRVWLLVMTCSYCL